jgi:ascorbate PTS system EIIB component
MKIITVCGMGFGTSLMVKMTIDDLLAEMGYKADVEACDIGSIMGKDADLIVTSTEMEGQLSGINADIIFLKYMTNKQEIKEKLVNYFQKNKG